jgi:hypothetical protein
MERKGYATIEPVSVVREGHEWTFNYELGDGDVELVVSWDVDDGWDAYVASFEPDRS